MKWLLDFMQRCSRHFEPGAKLHPLKPLFDAADNFLFSPPAQTPGPPHIRDPLDVKRYMSIVIIGLLPVTLASLYFFGLRMLLVIAVSYAAGGAFEVLFAVIRKEEINEGFLVTGLLFALILPPTLPLWMVAVGVAFGVVVGKELFGGTGRNPFNPALVGRCFLALGYPAAMSANWVKPPSGFAGRLAQYIDASSIDALTSATPLVTAKHGDFTPVTDLFFGAVAGSAGETCKLAVLIGGVYLIITRVANWRPIAGALGAFAILAGALHYAQPDRFAPVLWHLMAGSFLFGIFFMATDPVSSPTTNGGKWVYGIIIGIATVLIRNFTGYVEGVMFAILLGNIFAPILDEVAIAISLRRLNR